MEKLINYAVKSGCEHFAINYNYCRCVNNHTTISGQTNVCPICSGEIKEQYTRIVGYLTPVSAWNKGRKKEHSERVFKNESDFINNIDIKQPENKEQKQKH